MAADEVCGALARWYLEWQRHQQQEHGAARALNAVLRAHGAPGAAWGGDALGCSVGQVFHDRVELALTRVHRHFLANFAFTPAGGVESLVIDGAHDVSDDGASFTLTPRPDADAADGACERIHAALGANVALRRPIRVVRSRQLGSPFAPEIGFRYDGLYSPCRSGSRGRWAFSRLPNQPQIGRPVAAGADVGAQARLAASSAAKPARMNEPDLDKAGLDGAPHDAHATAARAATAPAGGAQQRLIDTFALACGSVVEQAETPAVAELEDLTVEELLEVRAALLLRHDPVTVLQACTLLTLEQGRVRSALEALHDAARAAPTTIAAIEPWPRRCMGGLQE
ncbi:hypothetical protein KFE25_008605 [Diacronema lutheri]|uniref:YDG domain-containing protein n=1 Tax=Diacronema lutheri TaxID=2081491 RepID=A0A8J6CF01_DIALT|nr:hypothetical protein KFE25_008605 [Diacronema lutheri]